MRRPPNCSFGNGSAELCQHKDVDFGRDAGGLYPHRMLSRKRSGICCSTPHALSEAARYSCRHHMLSRKRHGMAARHHMLSRKRHGTAADTTQAHYFDPTKATYQDFDPFYQRLGELSVAAKIPAMCQFRQGVEAGCLAGYGISRGTGKRSIVGIPLGNCKACGGTGRRRCEVCGGTGEVEN